MMTSQEWTIIIQQDSTRGKVLKSLLLGTVGGNWGLGGGKEGGREIRREEEDKGSAYTSTEGRGHLRTKEKKGHGNQKMVSSNGEMSIGMTGGVFLGDRGGKSLQRKPRQCDR